MQRVGSRAQVMHGNAKMTGGGLIKKPFQNFYEIFMQKL